MVDCKIILNPVSGHGAGETAIPEISSLINQAGLTFELENTAGPGHAIEIASQAAKDGYPVIIAAGGDGTVNEVINGLMITNKTQISTSKLGVLPIGRGNDFAYGAGIPHSLENAVAVIADQKSRLMDVGIITGGDYPTGRYFGNGVGIGFDAVVGFEAMKMKRIRGFLSYLIAAIKTIMLYYKAPVIQIEYNQKSYQIPALMVSVMNGRRMGGAFQMAPSSVLNDGLFDICIAKQVSRPQIFNLILKFMNGTQTSHSAIQMARTSSVTISAIQGTLPAHADGETICTAGAEIRIEILPGELEILSKSDHSA